MLLFPYDSYGNKTFYGRIEPIEYRIIYKLNGGYCVDALGNNVTDNFGNNIYEYYDTFKRVI